MTVPNFLLLGFSLAMNLLSCAVLRNDFCKKRVKTGADLYVFNAVSAAVSMVCFAVVGAVRGTLHTPSFYTLGMGVLFGGATAFCAILAMKALETGPLSYTNVIVFCSMVIPALSGLVLYGEPVSALQYVGIALMVVSFVFAVDTKNEASGASLRWFFLCLGAFLCNGAVGVMQKVHQNSAFREESAAFLLTAFAVYAILSVCLCLWHTKQKKEPLTVTAPGRKKTFALYAVLTGIGIAACNQINLYLAGAMPAVIFYPVFNGAAMLLTGVIGLVFFKEKLTKKQGVGLAAGAAAILLLCNVFG